MELFYEVMYNEYDMNTKRWVIVFRVLANVNRLEIIRLLAGGRTMNVSDIARALKISIKATSNHLAILKNVGVLKSHGASGHVFYSLDPKLPKDFQKALALFLR